MKVLSLIFSVFALGASALDILEMGKLIGEHWEAQAAGDAEAFVATLAPHAKITVNGMEDNAPFTDLAFVKDLFSRVKYSPTKPSVAPVFMDKNTIMVIFEWGATLTETFEYQELGTWQQKVTFTDEGKIAALSSICDGELLVTFSELLTKGGKDHEATIKALIESYNKEDVKAVQAAFDPVQVRIIRNGNLDAADWTSSEFLLRLFDKASVNAQLDGFAAAGDRATYAHIGWSFTVGSDSEPYLVSDAWYITWSPEGVISQIQSTIDLTELAELYKAIGYDRVLMQKYQEMQAKAQAARQGGAGAGAGAQAHAEL